METMTAEIQRQRAAYDVVRVVEVGPRDGLQNSRVVLPVEARVWLVEALVSAGLRDVEVGAFVHPKWIPQMALTGEVLKQVRRQEGVRYWGLVPNMKGLEAALAAGLQHVAVFVSSSETHNRHNLNRTISESMEEIAAVMAVCRAEGLAVRGYISTVFGCPFEGAIDFNRVLGIATQLIEQGAQEISLGDTTGEGIPKDVEPKLQRALAVLGSERVALHLHDTKGVALVIAAMALRLGVRAFDGSVGGLGGCPYAPGAAGNLATEDLVNLLDGLDVPHGVNLERLVDAAQRLQQQHGLKLSSRYLPFALARRQAADTAP
jgi:hydroxymethylglutaryl-CoA lyase